MTKECTKCKQDKQLTEFHKCKLHKSGYKSQCKVCRKESSANRYINNKEHINKVNKEWARNNKDKVRAKGRRWYHNHTEQANTQHKTWKQANPDKVKNSALKSNYGITLEQYNEMLEKQKECCDICGTSEPIRKSSNYFCVDHCHKTGKVRGLLCMLCNSLLGKAKDSKQRLLNAISYLEDSERG